MKPLIAIVTCHRFSSRANAQRTTWLKRCQHEYKFFLGNQPVDQWPDEVFLDVPDDYKSLPIKVQAMCQWAIAHGYDAVFKCDDDTYVLPEKLEVPSTPYVGRLNSSNFGVCPLGWCSGFAYWLTGEAIKLVAEAPKPEDTREDLWVGKVLNSHGIKCIDYGGFIPLSIMAPPVRGGFIGRAVAVCEFPDGKMIELHDLFTNPARIKELHTQAKANPRLGRIIQGYRRR